ncbi:MAG: fused DSP-PTPase phosphatase/NAD kinase-like protein [Bdellovibrio sp.]
MRRFFATILLLVVTSTALGSNILGPNFHEVDRGNFYRSAQLNEKEFARYIQKYRIQTIINLRGQNPDQPWYQDELAVSQKYGVQHFDISMSAKALPHRENLLRLLELYETAPRPILIHCQGGADRSGEAAAIYQMLYQGKSKKEALKQLTLRYHHAQKFKPAKRYFIESVWQGENWAYNNYYPCDADYRFYDKNNPRCLEP